MKNFFDIIIVGSSYSGMACALALADIANDLKIAIVEKENIFAQQKPADGRAYAISAKSLEFFKKINIYDDLTAYAGRISDIKITDDKSPFVLDFIGNEVDPVNNQLGQIIENHYIFEALKKRLLLQKNITIFCPNHYQSIDFVDENAHDNAKVIVKLADNQEIKAKLLLACDGRFSKLREYFSIPTRLKNYQQIAMVFKINHQLPHQNIAYEKFLRGGPLAILPLQDQHQSSIVWIAKNNQAEVIKDLDQENFLQQLHKKMEFCLGQCQVISEKFSYPLTLVEAQKFYHQNAILIGDAGCGIHPIAGQGFNLAIAGIEILQELLQKNILCGLNYTDQAFLENYHKSFRVVSKKMLLATDILNSIFESDSLSLAIMRDLGLGMINSSKKIKKFFIKNAGGY
ncbi:MAG: FAD-dependent monooxygenase [Alphaproteobacteria bacterium]